MWGVLLFLLFVFFLATHGRRKVKPAYSEIVYTETVGGKKTSRRLGKIKKIRSAAQEDYDENQPRFTDTKAEECIDNRNRLLILYKDVAGGITERKIDIYYSKFGYIWAYCHFRKGPRTFKHERVYGYKILSEKFEWDEQIADSIRKKALGNMNKA